MTTTEKGNVALTQAIAYFGIHNYTISIPLNDSQWYDLIVEKDNIFQSVQVKYTGEQNDNGLYICPLRTISGTTRKKIYSIKDTAVDLLFCYCQNGLKFLIPVKEIKTSNTILLFDKKNKCLNKKILDTSKFLVCE